MNWLVSLQTIFMSWVDEKDEALLRKIKLQRRYELGNAISSEDRQKEMFLKTSLQRNTMKKGIKLSKDQKRLKIKSRGK